MVYKRYEAKILIVTAARKYIDEENKRVQFVLRILLGNREIEGTEIGTRCFKNTLFCVSLSKIVTKFTNVRLHQMSCCVTMFMWNGNVVVESYVTMCKRKILE